jgi:hypothetical protein
LYLYISLSGDRFNTLSIEAHLAPHLLTLFSGEIMRKNKLYFLLLITVTTSILSCGPNFTTDSANTETLEIAQPQKRTPPVQIPDEIQVPETAPVQKKTPEPLMTTVAATEKKTTFTNADLEPLAWEKFKLQVPNAKLWTKMIYEIIEKKAPEIVTQNSADDVELFCPKYRSLNDKQRLNFWAQLVVAVAKFESSWRATSSTAEYKMNYKDSVTHQLIRSEGLLQLSYQDEKNYGLKCGFDWNADKKYKSEDQRKTILDPYKNLNCGIQILAYQLRRFRKIAVTDTRQLYWSVLFSGRSNKIKQISDITKSLSFCK